jgi:predicted NUDIX family NTP pyrophosphohydrolase
MPKQSAGILLHRFRAGQLEVFLVHPGGPFWAKKDLAAWSVPKGEIEDGEEPEAAARRELREETGIVVDSPLQPLGVFKASGGKIIQVWTREQDCDPASIVSGTFSMEWPPKSGRMAEFPEVDRAEWFPIDLALTKIHKGQQDILVKTKAVVGEGR